MARARKNAEETKDQVEETGADEPVAPEEEAPAEPPAPEHGPPAAGEAPAEDPVAEEAEAVEPEAEAAEPVEEPASVEPEAEGPSAESEEAPAPEEPEAAEPEAEPAAAAPAAPEAAPKKKKRLPRAERRQRPRSKRQRSTERNPIVRLPAPERERGTRKERRGVVVSAAMDKTIVVRVDTVKPHPVYKKIVRHSSKFHAHDEGNLAKAGDLVRIVETRPLSKKKNWRLVEVLEEAK
jgi:small subunit ribosomal protein S17